MSKKYLKKFLILTVIIGVFLIAIYFVNAYSLQNLNEFTQQTQAETGLQKAGAAEVVAMVINIFLGLVGILFVILIIYGGVQWLISAGSPDKIGKAKKVIIYAIVGIAIVTTAYTITYFITSALEQSPADTTQEGGDSTEGTKTCSQLKEELGYISYRCVPKEEACADNEMSFSSTYSDCGEGTCCVQYK